MPTLLRKCLPIFSFVSKKTDSDISALESAPWTWQEGQFYTANLTGFTPYYQFCDYVENVWPNSTNKVPGAGGVGLTKALDGYVKYFTEQVLPGCKSFSHPSLGMPQRITDFCTPQTASPVATLTGRASTTRSASRTSTPPTWSTRT
jgi:hypothetical protein